MKSNTILTAAPQISTTRSGRGFWKIAYAFAVMMAFSAAPTPLYVLYQQRDGFGPFTVTIVFAAYAVGVVLSVFLVGHVSDWIGRRRVLLWALVINMVAALVFLLPGLTSLLIARFVSGISIGILTATVTAYLMELHLKDRPQAGRQRADLVATAANVGGIGLGPLIAGLLAEYAPAPLTLPYLVFEVLLIVAVGLALRTPETVVPRHERWRPQRLSVPTGYRVRYAAACVTACASFAIFGLFTSLAPGFLVGVLGQRSHALAGFVAFLVFAAGVAGQLALMKLSAARQAGSGIAALVIGLAVLLAGIWLPNFALFLIGGLLTGFGAGAAFKGAVATTLTVAAPMQRGEALAGLFLIGYIGLAGPVLGLGLATQHLSIRTAVLIFASALAALLIAAARPQLRTQ